MADNKDIKLLHTWEIPFVKEVEETSDETLNGQVVKVVRKVQKEIPVKMGLRKMTRREDRDAEVFFGKQVNNFVKKGFLTRSMMINEHMNLTGGILSEKERHEYQDSIVKYTEMEEQVSKLMAAKAPQEEIDKIRKEMLTIRSRLSELNMANESVFAYTADTKALELKTLWVAFMLTMIERNGVWVPYFEGQGSDPDETFSKRQDFMWELEENEDAFYALAMDKISTYVGWFMRGARTKEQFELIEKEANDQIKAREEELKKKAEEAAAKTPEQTSSDPEKKPDSDNSDPEAPAPVST